jgi:hypothetical protein
LGEPYGAGPGSDFHFLPFPFPIPSEPTSDPRSIAAESGGRSGGHQPSPAVIRVSPPRISARQAAQPAIIYSERYASA